MNRPTTNLIAALALGVASFALAGCETTHHARVDDGAGLADGSAVMVSGVRVGSVSEVRVVEGEVDVAFVIEDAHELTLREDTCALALRGDGEPTLIIVPGEGAPLTEERTLPQCELRDQALRGLVEQFGDTIGGLLRSLGSGLLGGSGNGPGNSSGGFPIPSLPPIPPPAPAAPAPPVPPPPPFGAEPTCPGLSARVDSIERAAPRPLHLPRGGYRVWFEFSNSGDRTMEISAISQATFTDRDRRAMNPAGLPGESNIWFMPFDVPAHGTARRAVVFDAPESPQIDEIEVRGSSVPGGLLERCTLRGTGLSR